MVLPVLSWIANTQQEENVFNEDARVASLVDDKTFRRTKEYTTITDLLRLLHNALVKIIESWENFEKGEIQYFEVEEYQALRKSWHSYLAAISKDMSELRYLRRSLLQRIEMFDNKRSGVSNSMKTPPTLASRGLTVQLVNASAMVETRVATLQGNDIGRLTRVTVVGQQSSLCALVATDTRPGIFTTQPGNGNQLDA